MYRYPDFKITLARQKRQLYKSAGLAEAGSRASVCADFVNMAKSICIGCTCELYSVSDFGA